MKQRKERGHIFDSSACFQRERRQGLMRVPASHLSRLVSTWLSSSPLLFLSSRPTLSIQQHPPSAAISIQRPAQPRDAATRITLPSHPAIGTQKPQLHTMAQVNCEQKKILLLRLDVSFVPIFSAMITFGRRLVLGWQVVFFTVNAG